MPDREPRLRARMAWVVLFLALAAVLIVIVRAATLMYAAIAESTGEADTRRQLAAFLATLLQPRPATDDFADVRYADTPPYGVNTFFEQEVETWKLEKSMQMLRDAGVRYVRQQMPWSDIEVCGKGCYVNEYGQNTWEKYDRFIRLANQYGLEIVARLDFPPNWTRKDNFNTLAPPDNFADYGDFVYAFVRRYRGQIHYYQLWNEPNTEREWRFEPVNAREFVDLLRTGYQRAKEADPSVVILSPALAPTIGSPNGHHVSDLSYLEEMYRWGGGAYFDILAAQAYGLWTGPGDRRLGPDRFNFSRPQLLREVMVRHGDAHKPIWITEVGWDALPLDFPGEPTHGRVTRDQQALYTRDAYQRARDEWPWAGPLFLWHFRLVHDENRNQVLYYFGMLDADFTVHPVYTTYQQFATAPPYIPYGRHQETMFGLAYDGDWRAGADTRAALGSYRETAAAGSRLRFTFKGTGLALVTRRSPDAGRLQVQIDDRPSPTLTPDRNGRTVVDLRSDADAWQQSVWLAQGLSDGLHTATLVALDAGAPVQVDAVMVFRPESSPWTVALAALLTGGLTAVGAIALLRRLTAAPNPMVRNAPHSIS